MGALVPISPPPRPCCCWVPEDDLLLKNAAEAGASLESLAKGAVKFSHQYTILELQNRWHSLLYDPDISEPASVHMVELELSASNILSKSNKLADSKGNEIYGKRKDESLCSHYYAQRKRIRSEPFSNVDFSFLHPCHDRETIQNEHTVGNCIIGDPVVDQFDLHDSDFDIIGHGFPQVMRADTAAVGRDVVAANAFHSEQKDSFEGEIPDGIIGGDCLYKFAEHVPHVSVNKSIENSMLHSFEHDSIHENTDVLKENSSVFDTNSIVQGMGPPQQLPGRNIFEAADLMTNSFCEFDPVNNTVPICSGFGQNNGFSSPVLDCTVAFHQMEFSSPVPTMPIWRTMEDMSAPSILNSENLDDKDKGSGVTIGCPIVNAELVNLSGYDVVHPDPRLEDRTCDDGLKDSGEISDGAFFELSNSLMNFTNEEVLLFMDVGGKEMVDRSCLDGISSILLSSPSDVHPHDIPCTTVSKVSLSVNPCLVIPDATCAGELGVIGGKLQSGHKTSDYSTSVLSLTTTPNPHYSERCNSIICCTLNTEDPDIPCNDDISFSAPSHPPFVSRGLQHNSEDGGSISHSTMEFSVSGIANEQGLNYSKEEQLLPVSRVTEPQFLTEMCSDNPIDCGTTSELPERVSLDMTSRHISIAGGEQSQLASAHLTPYSISVGELKEDNPKVELEYCKFDSSMGFLLEDSVHCLDNEENHPQNIIDDHKHEPDVPGAIQNHMLAEHDDFGMPFPESVANLSMSDQEVQPCEDDNDLPHFSDIEAMILDMDLIPCDQDSYTEVSRYQHEKAKRAIVRLEEGAKSYMQRAIASHQAFAILYGRRLKHYIRKKKVLLGRATDDFDVDVDLAKEGRANKVSRRQAIIKMEEDGSFYLKNLGKFPILVNGNGLAIEQCIRLSSGCLIEIRSMNFIFEINHKVVKQYTAKIAKKRGGTGSKFEWSPEGVS